MADTLSASEHATLVAVADVEQRPRVPLRGDTRLAQPHRVLERDIAAEAAVGGHPMDGVADSA